MILHQLPLLIFMMMISAALGSSVKRLEEYAYDVEGFKSLGVKY